MHKSVPEIRFQGFTEDWEERKLGDYIIQYSEKTKQNNQYPVFTSSRNGLFFQKDYYKGNQIASEDNIGYNIVPKGYFTYRHMSDDLVFKFNINDLADYGIVSTLYPVFTTNEQLDSKYLQYQLNEGSEFRRFSLLQKQGGSRTYMYLNKLQNMILKIPKLEEQKKIGSFFKQLDDTIALHQRKLDLLKEQKKGYLQKMFPKNGEKVPELRFEGFSGDWEERKLGEVTESFDGKRIPIDSGLRISGKYPYYGATGIIDYVDDYIFDGEYVLLAEDGANITMRNYPVAYLTQGKFWLNNHAHIMRMIDGSNYFLVQILEKIDYRKYNTGTAQPKLNSKVVNNIEFKLPQVEEQSKIGSFFKQLDDTIALHQRKLDLLKEQKKGFLQKMFV